MHSTADEAKQAQLSSPSPSVVFDTQKIIGCLYLVAAVFILSTNVVLQAATLKDFPAPMSLCAITSLIGVGGAVSGAFILSLATLGDTIDIGSLAGMFLMFTGLYFVLWAKGKEGYYQGDDFESEFNAEKKPLLS
ncbi:hypothetical protein FH972_011957 [Carpinus fangiana]|uniref:Uncharacterized protein n=1 Tax=Carpinus fangiana TaxID=176857 RepID=A0A5N6R2C9_9ROSI|nr:hypothetical protein FH972_011957 [Carpinus fangiana]